MGLELRTIPCLEDNYAFLLHNPSSKETLLIDAPEAEPIQAALAQEGWTLSDIVLTHHHWDHVDGLDALRGTARVLGAAADAHRLPPLDTPLTEGCALTLCGETVTVIDVPGHTIGHIALHFPQSGLLFTADSLMALGCGRLFEGTPAQMWESLQKLRNLPDDTLVCSGHEYTETNARFALTLETDNLDLKSRYQMITDHRTRHEPTVPSTLLEEKRTNPFLRADDPVLQAALNMTGADPVEVFTKIREKRNQF